MGNIMINLVILDGFGYKQKKEGNAIALAKMHNLKNWLVRYPNCLLNASGESVGLPDGFIGNSEVGHLTIGSGKVVESKLKKILNDIKSKKYFEHKILVKKIRELKETGNALHIMGIASDAGVHGHIDQIIATVELANSLGIKKIFVHAFLDGRDCPPKSAAKFLTYLESKIGGMAKLASIHGRFYAMDRDNNWERTTKSYNILCTPTTGIISTISWQTVLQNEYLAHNSDEFLTPTLLNHDGFIKENDGIVFTNFRPDRARQLTKLFCARKTGFFIANDLLYEKEEMGETLLDKLAKQNKKVLIASESEKHMHVTYFFRGEVEKNLPNETVINIPSIKAKNYIEHPEMSAREITRAVIENLNENNFCLINYANADMVGHSANLNATIKACEILDEELGKLYKEVVEKRDGILIITSDHGTAEQLVDPITGEPSGSHTTNQVPFIVVSKQTRLVKNIKLNNMKGLADIAEFILKLI